MTCRCCLDIGLPYSLSLRINDWRWISNALLVTASSSSGSWSRRLIAFLLSCGLIGGWEQLVEFGAEVFDLQVDRLLLHHLPERFREPAVESERPCELQLAG